jgi:hypothetical protein
MLANQGVIDLKDNAADMRALDKIERPERTDVNINVYHLDF